MSYVKLKSYCTLLCASELMSNRNISERKQESLRDSREYFHTEHNLGVHEVQLITAHENDFFLHSYTIPAHLFSDFNASLSHEMVDHYYHTFLWGAQHNSCHFTVTIATLL